MYYLTESGRKFLNEETERQSRARDIRHKRAYSGRSGKLNRRESSWVSQQANDRHNARKAAMQAAIISALAAQGPSAEEVAVRKKGQEIPK